MKIMMISVVVNRKIFQTITVSLNTIVESKNEIISVGKKLNFQI